MTDDSLIDTPVPDKRTKRAHIAGGVLLALQIMILMTYRNYLDFGHLILAIAYVVIALVTYWSLLKAKLIPSALGVLLAVGILGFQLEKVWWSENYLQNLTTSNAFIFEDYIETYPTLEEHIFAGILKRPDWIRFADECMQPALNRRPVPEQCRTPEQIDAVYRIKVDQEMQRFVGRMQKTAQDVEGGRIKSPGQYQKCIAEKRCAPIALLPDNVEAESLQGDRTQYIEIRQAFWDLIENKGLTPPVCLTMTLCRGLLAVGVVSFNAPPESAPAPQAVQEEPQASEQAPPAEEQEPAGIEPAPFDVEQ